MSTTTTVTAAEDSAAPAPFTRKTRHCKLFPIPPWLQYDPARPFEYSTLLICIFGFASTMTVSNLYYSQPLLSAYWFHCLVGCLNSHCAVQLAQSFNATYSDVANIPTLTQAGCVPTALIYHWRAC